MRVRSLSLLAGILAATALTSACAPAPRQAPPPPVTPATPAPVAQEAQLRALAARLMIVGVTDFDAARAALAHGAGGIFVVSWSNPELLDTPGRDIAALRAEFGDDFSVSIDFEGGRVQRHADVLGGLAAPGELAGGDAGQIRATARDLGERLRAHGVTVDFAPLADVDSAGLDIVGDRSFGREPQAAARGAAAFAAGLSDAGVRPVFKHFPGHGAASGDTHAGPAVTPPLAQLEKLDLAAFGTVLREVPDAGVMMGHLTVPGLTDGTTPASLDPAAYRLLRTGAYPGGVPFDGPVYTDDLSGMAAVPLSPPQAAARAVVAGADRALWSSGEGLDEAVDLVVAEVRAGNLSVEDLKAAAAA